MNREQTRAELDRITELEQRVQTLLRDIPGVKAFQCMGIAFEPRMSFTPVMLKVERNGGANKSPRRRDFPTGDEGKVAYKQAYAFWFAAAKMKAEQDIEAAKKVLRKNKIPYRFGYDYSWPILRLA